MIVLLFLVFIVELRTRGSYQAILVKVTGAGWYLYTRPRAH